MDFQLTTILFLPLISAITIALFMRECKWLGAVVSVGSAGVVLVVATAVNLFGLLVSLFSNFELQKRTSILSMLLITGYYILLSIYVLIVINSDDALTTLNLESCGVLYPFTVLVLNFMAFLAARRTEAQILAKASGFRLRD